MMWFVWSYSVKGPQPQLWSNYLMEVHQRYKTQGDILAQRQLTHEEIGLDLAELMEKYPFPKEQEVIVAVRELKDAGP